MAASKKDTDLLEEIDSEELDLLHELGEEDDGSEAWLPEAGDGIQGTVIARRTTSSQYHDEPVPVVVVEVKGKDKPQRVTGFQGVLRREIEEQDPQVGDLFAAKYFGTKEVKTGKWAGKQFHHYRVAVRRAPKAEAS